MSMSAQSWGRVKEILDTVLDAAPADRAGLIESLCGDDTALRRRVERYLDHEEAAEDFLEQPAYLRRREALEVGEIVGPYEIVERLGRGGMGAVYAARRHDDFNQEVALKVVRRGLDTDDILERFRNERQILARLEHPNIARLLDGGSTADGRPFFAMEKVDGEPIDTWCDRQRLGVRERLSLFLEVCDAVRAAHRNLIVHRDLKPGNILVDAEGRPKLLDFGIAKLLHEDQDLLTVRTRLGQRPLTLRWASPEQVRGEAVSTASDVYSLGLLLFELLTGRSPYRLKTGSDEEMTRSISDDEPTRPSAAVGLPVERPPRHGVTVEGAPRATDPASDPSTELSNDPASDLASGVSTDPESRAARRGLDIARLRRRLRGDLDAIVLKALRKDPEARYGSVEELVADLRRHLEGLPIEARPPTWTYRTGRFVRRNALAVSVAVLFAAVLVGWALTVTLQARQIVDERDRATAASEFLEELFLEVDPDESPGRDPSALDILAHGRNKLLGDEYSDRPRLRADLALTMGQVYDHLSATDEAIELFRLALDQRRRVYGETSQKILQAKHFLASVLVTAEQFDEAESLMGEIFAVMRESEDPDDADQLAGMLHTQAWLLHRRGRSARAEPLLREAIELKKGRLAADDPSVLSSRRNLSRILHALGRLDEARSETLAVLEARQEVAETDASDLATSWSDFGMVEYSRRRLDVSDDAFRKALGIRIEIYGDGHLAVARTRNNLARVLFRRGDLDAARDLHEKAYAVYRETSHTGFTGVLAKNLAVVLAQSDACVEALSLLDEAEEKLEALEILSAPAHRAEALSIRGWCTWRLGDEATKRLEGLDAMRAAVVQLEDLAEPSDVLEEAKARLGAAETGRDGIGQSARVTRTK